MNVSLDLFQVRDLIEKIREAFVETLDELQWMDEASKEKAREKVRDNKELQYSLMNMIYLAFCSITISSFSTNKRKRLRSSLLSCYIVLSFQSFVSPHQYKCQLATMQFPKKTHLQLWIELKTISTILITRKTPKHSTILWIKTLVKTTQQHPNKNHN